MRILIIDDTPDNIVTASAVIKIHFPDSNISSAGSGEAGIEIAKTEPVDVILLDVQIPGMGGYENCRRLKADPETGHIPVIMLSAVLRAPQDHAKVLDQGAETPGCPGFFQDRSREAGS